jgi:hypothetical protein
VALVFHAADEKLRCHYCDLRREPPAVCSGCGAEDAALLGIGTERVEEALRRLLPEARIARLDRDTAARRGYGEQVLGDLRDGRLDAWWYADVAKATTSRACLSAWCSPTWGSTSRTSGPRSAPSSC